MTGLCRARTCASASLRLVGDFVADRRRGRCRRSPHRRRPRRLAIERGQDILDRSPANSRSIAPRRAAIGASPGRLGERRQHRIDRHRAAERIRQIGEARRRHAMGGDAAPRRASAASAARRSARNRCRARPAAAAGTRSRRRPGKKPMPTSGMANSDIGRRRRGASRGPRCRRRRP